MKKITFSLKQFPKYVAKAVTREARTRGINTPEMAETIIRDWFSLTGKIIRRPKSEATENE